MDLTALENAAREAEVWMAEMMAALQTYDRAEALKCLRAGLRAVRESVSAEVAGEIAGQLPLIIRGLFFEGWSGADRRPLAFREMVTLIARRCDGHDARAVARAIFCVLEPRIAALVDDHAESALDSVLAARAA